MMELERKRRVAPFNLKVVKKYHTFEIKLPNHAQRVTGIYLSVFARYFLKFKVGTLMFQSQDESDVFLTTDLFGEDMITSDEMQIGINKDSLELDHVWIRGVVQKKIPLSLEGDTGVINGWFKATYTTFPYEIHMFIEYEEAEARL